MSEHLPEQTSDDLDAGWGESVPKPAPGSGPDATQDRDAWLREQVPPHHGD